MRETSNILALAAVLFLAASGAYWAIRLRGPMLQRLDGAHAANDRSATIVIKALLAAFVLSAAAAAVAVGNLLFG